MNNNSIREDAERLLCDKYNGVAGEKPAFADWIMAEAKSNQCFFRWLFEDDEISDYGKNLSPRRKGEYRYFVNRIAFPFRSELGAKIRYYRKKRGIDQSELSKKIGVDDSTISRIETGTIAITSDMLGDILGELRLKIEIDEI